MHPEDDIQALRHPRQIARLMGLLHAERGQLTLVTAAGGLEKTANLLAADAAHGRLVIDAFSGAEAEAFEHARDIRVKTVIEGIQTWFGVPVLARLHDRGDDYYHLPFPDVLYRLQRRGAFRVRLPATAQAHAQVMTVDGSRMLRGAIHDISITGVCFRFSGEDVGAFQVGEVFEHAQVSCDCGMRFDVRAAVSNLRAEGEKAILVGMRFIDLPPATERQLDRAVQAIQRDMMRMI